MRKTNLLKIMSLALILCVFFTSCNSSKNNTLKPVDIIENEIADKDYHKYSSNIEKTVSSDYLQMFIDKTSYTVSINDKNNNYTWYSIPEKDNSVAYAFGVTLYTENGIYNLNTQDNSVCFGTANYEKTDSGLTVSYILSNNKDTAIKSYDEITKNDAYVSFSVTYDLYEQSLTVNINTQDMKITPNGFISEISFLPYFGSAFDDSMDDYFLIPDNSGAIMYTAKGKNAVSVNIYGADPYIESSEKNACATVPVFGAKRNNNAFSAIITNGDALAKINASTSDSSSPSIVSPSFTLTPVKQSDTDILFGKGYNGNITVVYKFLADENANYVGMASAAREEFISNGTLSSKNYKSERTDIPFCVSVIGYQDDKALTTLQQTTDILGILKGKGIDNIQLIYKGLLSGGFSQKNLYSSKVLSSLGGQKEFESLYDYTNKLNYTLFTDVNILSSSKSYNSIKSSYSISGKNSTYLLNSDLSFREYNSAHLASRIGSEIASTGNSKRNKNMYSQIKDYTMYLSNTSSLTADFSSFLSSKIINSCDGLSVNDAGYILFSDKKNTRQENMHIISSLLKTVGTDSKLSVKTGNIYSLYSANYVSDMNFDTFYSESESYIPVPFVQAVIHGSMIYSGEPIDAADPLYKYNMLRYIEYGAIPSFEWVYDNSSIFCYDGYLLSERISEFSEYYEKANNVLASVSSETITGHREITENTDGKSISGVYCTSYSNNTDIYVNYTGTAVVTPENIVVGAYDFVKIER